MIYDDARCALGEGPLWHPTRKQLFWFDILNRRLYWKDGQTRSQHQFDTYVSAAGWIDDERLLVASDTSLNLFNIGSSETQILCPLETDNPMTRSNDGRADPWGGFWIGTMGINAEKDAGAIYRYYGGELRRLYAPITISNAICFSPDRRFAYFTDTPTQQIMRQTLDGVDGWPKGDPEVWLDLKDTDFKPDGAVVDANGNLWNAQWGAGRVACYAPDATYLQSVTFNAKQTTCAALGGPEMTTLFCTSAAVGLQDPQDSGLTLMAPNVATGQPEHQINL
jgi:sugar lactone lactonase YvrE